MVMFLEVSFHNQSASRRTRAKAAHCAGEYMTVTAVHLCEVTWGVRARQTPWSHYDLKRRSCLVFQRYRTPDLQFLSLLPESKN